MSRGRDYYEKGKPLRRAGIFQILAEEAWRDGEVSKADSAMLESFRKYLRLKNQRAMEAMDRAEEKFRAGTIGSLRDFSPKQCYARAVRYAYSDDPELSEREEKYLKGLRAATGLKDSDHEKVMAQLARKGWVPGVPNLPGGDSVVAPLSQADLQRLRKMAPPPDHPEPGDPDGSVVLDFEDVDETKAPHISGSMKEILEQAEELAEAKAEDAAAAPPEPAAPVDATPAASAGEVPSAGSTGGAAGTRSAGAEALPAEVPAAEDPAAEDPAPKAPAAEAPAAKAPAAAPPAPEPPAAEPAPAATSSPRRRAPPSLPRPTPRKRPQAASEPPSGQSPAMRKLLFNIGVFLVTVGAGLSVVHLLPSSSGGGRPRADGLASSYRDLVGRFGPGAYQVRTLNVRGPDGPGEAPLDLGEAWDLHAGQDGKLYGTASYRIFQVDPKTGQAKWVAGVGRIGEPKEGQPALDSMMDPASPRVDRDGVLYFRQGSSAIFRVGEDGLLERILGTRERRQIWKDGDLASEAKPGAIEQLELDLAGRVYFDEYSGDAKGPEVLGRVEIDGKMRALFMYALSPVQHPYRRLMRTFVGSSNGFENLHVGRDGGIYFVVGDRLYLWKPGAGPSKMLLEDAPDSYAVAKDGSVLVVHENRVERWKDLETWTRESRSLDVVAGESDEAESAGDHDGWIPGTAAGFSQPRDLAIGPDGTLYLMDGASGGSGIGKPRIEMIRPTPKRRGG